MSPEVIRSVWDEHRRLRCRRRLPLPSAPSRATTGVRCGPPAASNPHQWISESPTTTSPDHSNSQSSESTGSDLPSWSGSDCDDQTTRHRGHGVEGSQAVFLGVELVDWLQWRVPRLRRRSAAIHYSRQLLLDGLIYQVDVEDDSCTDHRLVFRECCLYAFTPEPSNIHREHWQPCLRPNTVE